MSTVNGDVWVKGSVSEPGSKRPGARYRSHAPAVLPGLLTMSRVGENLGSSGFTGSCDHGSNASSARLEHARSLCQCTVAAPQAFAPSGLVKHASTGGAPVPMQGRRCQVRCRSTTLRPAQHAIVCLAKLRSLPKLRGGNLSQAVQPIGMALHRTLLSLSTSSTGMAKGHVGMG